MTFDEFITKWLGKKCDFDGFYGGQCVDLYRFYVQEVLGFEQSPGVGGAAEIWDSADPDYYEFVKNTPDGVPDKGDIVIWNRKAGGGFGHVAIFIEGNINSFTSLDQNWPTLDKVTKTNHTYINVIGWMKPKGNSMSDCLLANTEENRKKYEYLVGNSTKYDALVRAGFGNIEENKKKLESEINAKKEAETARDEINKTLISLNQTITSKNVRIAELDGEVSTLENKLLDSESRVNSLIEQTKKLIKIEKENEHLTEAKLTWVKAEETYNRRIGQLQAENDGLRAGIAGIVFKVLYQELTKNFRSSKGN